ncbi:hypothetical protein CEXT_766761 [Caerostris extrusa]|uniref:Uncharacterized protein n=1 Tax=Caerostris extrusa TaxID=172846 RepID=A0AAV4WEN4_CAEEX|nr:hypothetical protein CEXT_766761 [Caerostris extrusa]
MESAIVSTIDKQPAWLHFGVYTKQKAVKIDDVWSERKCDAADIGLSSSTMSGTPAPGLGVVGNGHVNIDN